MVDDGLMLKIPRPDVCLGLHVVPGPAGRVMSAAGPVLTGCDTITIDITGRSAHGSMPHNGVDPTYIAAAIVMRLQGIVGREVSPHEFAVISVGTLSSGNSNNTIPGHARIVLNIRYYSDEVRGILINAIERVVRAECMASGAGVEPRFTYSDHGDVTDNDPEVFADVRAAFDGVFGAESVTAERWTASEDFSDIPNAFGSPLRLLDRRRDPAGAVGRRRRRRSRPGGRPPTTCPPSCRITRPRWTPPPAPPRPPSWPACAADPGPGAPMPLHLPTDRLTLGLAGAADRRARPVPDLGRCCATPPPPPATPRTRRDGPVVPGRPAARRRVPRRRPDPRPFTHMAYSPGGPSGSDWPPRRRC